MLCYVTSSVHDQLIHYLILLQIFVRHIQRMRYDLPEYQYQTLETSDLALSQIRRMVHVHTDSFTGMEYIILILHDN